MAEPPEISETHDECWCLFCREGGDPDGPNPPAPPVELPDPIDIEEEY